MEVLHSQLDAREVLDPNLHTILGRLETLVDRQEERIQTLEGQLDWVQNRQALCPCIRSRTLALVHEGLEEEASEGSGETGDKPQFSWSGHLGNIARKCTMYLSGPLTPVSS